MVERNSPRGRKPIMREMELKVIHTSKKAKLVFGKDEIVIPKGQNLLLTR
jgi:hypothetical protein